MRDERDDGIPVESEENQEEEEEETSDNEGDE